MRGEAANPEAEAWKELALALEGLLACYRTGNSRRIDAVLGRVEKARKRIEELEAGKP